MCCCGKPVKNGEPGYRWQPQDAPGIRKPFPPPLPVGAVVIHDEPGRCSPTVGGKLYAVDHHSHHYRLIRNDSGYRLFVQHGGGTEEIGGCSTFDLGKLALVLATLDSDGRFVLFMSLDSLARNAARSAQSSEAKRWREAAAEKRIKTRKQRGGAGVKVWIEPRQEAAAV